MDAYNAFVQRLSDEERAMLADKRNFYVVEFRNVGGLVMPIIVELTYEDGSSEIRQFPAETWSRDNVSVSKLMITKKAVAAIKLDPRLETADVDTWNNNFPRQIEKSRFELYREGRGRSNAMQRAGVTSDWNPPRPKTIKEKEAEKAEKAKAKMEAKAKKAEEEEGENSKTKKQAGEKPMDKQAEKPAAKAPDNQPKVGDTSKDPGEAKPENKGKLKKQEERRNKRRQKKKKQRQQEQQTEQLELQGDVLVQEKPAIVEEMPMIIEESNDE